MNQENQHYFYFTRRERAGTLVLIVICLATYLLPVWFNRLRPPQVADFSRFQKALNKMNEGPSPARRTPAGKVPVLFYFDPNRVSHDSLVALGVPPRTARNIINYRENGGQFHRREDLRKIYTLRSEDYERLAPYVRLSRRASFEVVPPERKEVPVSLFVFDPNQVSAKELRRLGLSGRVAATFIRYREKGGRFYEPADIGKVYGVTEADVERLLPYVQLPEKEAQPQERATAAKAKGESIDKPAPIDINQADAEVWRQLYGIGPVLSERIVRFREKLGGFVRVEQVGETYGLPDSTFEQLRHQLTGSPITRPLAINRLGKDELGAHPYIDRRLARAIVAYRLQHGPFKSSDDLEKMRAMPEKTREKLLPYLYFE